MGCMNIHLCPSSVFGKQIGVDWDIPWSIESVSHWLFLQFCSPLIILNFILSSRKSNRFNRESFFVYISSEMKTSEQLSNVRWRFFFYPFFFKLRTIQWFAKGLLLGFLWSFCPIVYLCIEWQWLRGVSVALLLTRCALSHMNVMHTHGDGWMGGLTICMVYVHARRWMTDHMCMYSG